MTAEWLQRVLRGGWAEDFKRYMQGHRSIPIGPRNTWSNLAYVLAGLWIALDGMSASALILALCLLTLAIGSGLYHALKYRWANDLDWVGMYATMGALAGNGIVANSLPRSGFAIIAMVAIALAFIIPFQRRRFDWHMGVLYLIASVPAFLWGSWYYASIGLVAFGVAYGCWLLDRKGYGRWFHSFWHILTAIAIAATYFAR